MRTSENETKGGVIVNGYDYERQAWIVNGVYIACGHAESMDCTCYGRMHEGEKAQSV